jgi:hypothetical protein
MLNCLIGELVNWSLDAGYWLLVAGCWSKILFSRGYWLLVTGYWLLVEDPDSSGMLVFGFWLLVITNH